MVLYKDVYYFVAPDNGQQFGPFGLVHVLSGIVHGYELNNITRLLYSAPLTDFQLPAGTDLVPLISLLTHYDPGADILQLTDGALFCLAGEISVPEWSVEDCLL